MSIRQATVNDASAITEMLTQLGYPGTEDFLADKMKLMLLDSDEELFVYEMEGRAVGFMSLHFIPQIALPGDLARISYFVVDANFRSYGIGDKMEAHAVELARARNCQGIELHCSSYRTDAHRFYQRQGYEESPKYFIKRLD